MQYAFRLHHSCIMVGKPLDGVPIDGLRGTKVYSRTRRLHGSLHALHECLGSWGFPDDDVSPLRKGSESKNTLPVADHFPIRYWWFAYLRIIVEVDIVICAAMPAVATYFSLSSAVGETASENLRPKRLSTVAGEAR